MFVCEVILEYQRVVEKKRPGTKLSDFLHGAEVADFISESRKLKRARANNVADAETYLANISDIKQLVQPLETTWKKLTESSQWGIKKNIVFDLFVFHLRLQLYACL